MYLKHVITAGILSAALAIGPGAAFAQTSGTTSGTLGHELAGQQFPGSGLAVGHHDISTASSAQRQSGSGGSGADQEAVRQHLSGAREALAELTKLPAASQLQGEQRQQVAQLISDFNAFATATTDWRPKYDTIDRELDQILGLERVRLDAVRSGTQRQRLERSASGSAGASTGTTADASAAAPQRALPARWGRQAARAAGALDPAILAKLREVRTHLDGFEEASGDPDVRRREDREDPRPGRGWRRRPAAPSAPSGSSDSASAGGSVTLDRRAGARSCVVSSRPSRRRRSGRRRRRVAGGGRLAGRQRPVASSAALLRTRPRVGRPDTTALSPPGARRQPPAIFHSPSSGCTRVAFRHRYRQNNAKPDDGHQLRHRFHVEERRAHQVLAIPREQAQRGADDAAECAAGHEARCDDHAALAERPSGRPDLAPTARSRSARARRRRAPGGSTPAAGTCRARTRAPARAASPCSPRPSRRR